MIALFFATQTESQLILEKLKESSKFSIRGVNLIKGKIKNIDTLLCISGIGKVNSSISALITFENFTVKKVVIAGVAGAYPSSGLKIGDIALAEKEIDADEGLLISCDDTENSFILIKKEEVNLFIPEHFKKLPSGVFLTVSACTGNLGRARFLERKFNAICENMEGFAVAKVAQIYNIPTIEIRSISNTVTLRDRLLEIDEVREASEIVQRFIIEKFPLF